MNVDEVMTEVAERLRTIEGLRVADHGVDKVNPPHAVVSLPRITFDAAYGRGMDRYELPVILAIGKVVSSASRANMAPYVAGAGPKSVKAAIDTDDEWASCDAVRVVGVEFDVIAWSGIEYLTATFTLDIAGDGA